MPKACGPHRGKLERQLLGVVTLAYDLLLAIIIPRFEYLKKEEKNKEARLGLS